MGDHIRCFLTLAALLLLLAGAGGIGLPPREAHVAMPDQKAILVYDEASGHEDLILSIASCPGLAVHRAENRRLYYELT